MGGLMKTRIVARLSTMNSVLRNQVRLLFVLVVLAGACAASASGQAPVDPSAFTTGSPGLYLVVYRPGAAWVEGKPMPEQQAMKEHFAYYVGLHRKGMLIAAGGFTEVNGGAAVLRAETDAAAAEILAADPAVISGTFRFELQRWKPNAWEEISRKRAARGE
jgi:uncharacterized protein YciI